MLLVNKQIYAEVIEFVFTKNIFNMIRPSEGNIVLRNLGKSIHDSIRTLEFPVHGKLANLGEQWKVMADCINLSALRLVFYHNLGWHSCFGELAQYIMSQNEHLVLDMELYTSIMGQQLYMGMTDAHLYEWVRKAEIASAIYSLKVPKQLRQITLTASVAVREASDLLNSFLSEGKPWAFKKVGYQKGPPEMTCLRWCKRNVRDDELKDQVEYPNCPDGDLLEGEDGMSEDIANGFESSGEYF